MWEIPRLCRGGSRSLTVPAVCFAAPQLRGAVSGRRLPKSRVSASARLRSGPFERPATVKPPALPGDKRSVTEDPIGKRILKGPQGQWATVTGVAGDVTNLGATRQSWPEYYIVRKYSAVSISKTRSRPRAGVPPS